ncbi:hypothetical protein Q7P37_009937 [Cladosporium fusiforme]
MVTLYDIPAEPEPEPACEAPPADVCEYEVQNEPCCSLDEAARPPTEQDVATNEGVSEVIVDTNALPEDANIAEGGKSGFGFTWCVRCARVDAVLYGSKTLPTGLRGVESQLDNGIAPSMCGDCKREGGGNHGYWGDDDFRSSFEKLRLSPRIFRGSEVAEAARAILSVEVAFITVKDGVAFKDIDEIMRGLTVEDRVMSVDMEGFRRGKRENLLLPYLVGGLTR